MFSTNQLPQFDNEKIDEPSECIATTFSKNNTCVVLSSIENTATSPSTRVPSRMSSNDEGDGLSSGDDEAFEEKSEQHPPGLPSIGSAGHPDECKPCAWVYESPGKSRGCAKGAQCSFCHLCGRRELKRRKRSKVANLKAGKAKPKESSSPQLEPCYINFRDIYTPECSPLQVSSTAAQPTPGELQCLAQPTPAYICMPEGSQQSSLTLPPGIFSSLAYVRRGAGIVMGSQAPDATMSQMLPLPLVA